MEESYTYKFNTDLGVFIISCKQGEMTREICHTRDAVHADTITFLLNSLLTAKVKLFGDEWSHG